MPCNAAVYVSSVDKIFGIYGPYIFKFNATTGQREAAKLLLGPCDQTSSICWHAATSKLYVSTWNSMQDQYAFLNHTNVDIFPVDPATLALGTGLGWSSFYGDTGGARQSWPDGPRFLMDAGNAYIYFIGTLGRAGVTWLGRINPLAPAAETTVMADLQFWGEQAATDGTMLYFTRAYDHELVTRDLNFGSDDFVQFAEIGQLMPISVEHCPFNGKQYVVCGNEFMARIDTWTPRVYTLLNLNTVNAGSDPLRIRYRAANNQLYIPCMSTDGIIVWDPASDTGVFKSGFTSPIDVVFTPSKAFAVQSGPIGLREIT